MVSLTRSRGVQHRLVTPSGATVAWEPLGGVLTNDPVVTITPEGLTHVFGRGLDGRIWVLDNCEGETAPLVWSGWRQLNAGAPPADECRRT